jgi:hypothetical protein
MPVPTKNEDLLFGLQSEEKHKATLEQFFGCGLRKTGTYDPMDYTDEAQTIFIEMKTRRIKHDLYPTALIGKNKVDFCKTSNATCYFVYVYLDGLFYVKYDPALFETFECADFERGWREGGIQPRQLYYYIPHQHLNHLRTSSSSE